MIKKFFHYVCVLIFGILWSSILGVVFQQLFFWVYNINLLNPQTYQIFADFWNSGGVLAGKDVLMILSLQLYLPICFYGWYKLYHYKFMRLITVPLNKIVNSGLDDYRAPDVNIKNLKIEEKKTLEQVVQERLEAEKKKSQTNKRDSADFRKKIIEQIEENKK
ncbi:MAG: hypothetical protein IJ677_06375 [Alphaproteobacteria bacterium]|nr:hypothetical protein [Alphaproteobacteria bacterium]